MFKIRIHDYMRNRIVGLTIIVIVTEPKVTIRCTAYRAFPSKSLMTTVRAGFRVQQLEVLHGDIERFIIAKIGMVEIGVNDRFTCGGWVGRGCEVGDDC